MKRRAFLTFLAGGLALGPWYLRAQPSSAPVIGFLNSTSAGAIPECLAAFSRGLGAGGYADGRNVTIEYRWAEGDDGRLQDLAAELVRRRPSLIVAAGGTGSAHAARSATETIPLVLIDGANPTTEGLVGLRGGNTTGASLYAAQLAAKRLELLRELVPNAATIALLVNPSTVAAGMETTDLQKAAAAAGLQLLVFNVSGEAAIETAFASAAQQRAGALLISADPFFTGKRARIVELATAYRIPTAYPWREYAMDGGLMSYSPSICDAYRQVGDYAGRILKGAKPGDLPTQLPTKFELILNLPTAKALGIEMPLPLLIAASEVIE
jgi:ABC-type uncharacterized transport system substrate-binding protein